MQTISPVEEIPKKKHVIHDDEITEDISEDSRNQGLEQNHVDQQRPTTTLIQRIFNKYANADSKEKYLEEMKVMNDYNANMTDEILNNPQQIIDQNIDSPIIKKMDVLCKAYAAHLEGKAEATNKVIEKCDELKKNYNSWLSRVDTFIKNLNTFERVKKAITYTAVISIAGYLMLKWNVLQKIPSFACSAATGLYNLLPTTVAQEKSPAPLLPEIFVENIPEIIKTHPVASTTIAAGVSGIIIGARLLLKIINFVKK